MARPEIISEWGVEEGTGVLSFDLSVIPHTVFEDLLEAWRLWLPGNVQSLELNCRTVRDVRQQAAPDAADSIEYPRNVKESIDIAGDYGPRVIEFLKFLISSSTILNTLSLFWIDIDVNDLGELIEILPESQSLHALRLSGVRLGDEGLKTLLQKARPHQLRQVEIQECDVTDASLPAIEGYVAEGHVSKFIVDDDEFSDQSLRSLETLVEDGRARVIAENEKLRTKILQIRQMVEEDEWTDGHTFALGPGAENLSQTLVGEPPQGREDTGKNDESDNSDLGSSV
jgi:hypothetical protein